MKRSHEAVSPPRINGEESTHTIVAPKISKARACAECKRHKIKCEVKPGETSCTKCLKSGAKCVANDFSQRFVDDDVNWKAQATNRMQRLEAAVSYLLRENKFPSLSAFDLTHSPGAPSDLSSTSNHASSEVRVNDMNATKSLDMTRENSQEPMPEEPDLVPAPMGTLYEVTKLRNLRSNQVGKPKSTLMEEDFISRGCISLHEAEELFAYFRRTLNQLLWGGIILLHSDLSSVRRSSSLLSAAILTVSALHIPNRTDTLNKCYNEFVSLIGAATLSRYHTLDDIRARCIGAFWLPDLSWKLSGQAVRIATEINLHHSFLKMTRGQTDQFERAKLWYLIYVCEHHFSIAYGRPPSIHEDAAIKNYETFLQSPSAVPGDVRLIAQVALFVILTEAYRIYGSDTEQALTESDFGQLRSFNRAIEQWRMLWQPRSLDNPYVRTYPSKGVVLHYHFARFQLNSLALRAISPNMQFSPERKEAANVAISSAMATLNLVLEEVDLRDAVVGVPIFTHTMITFSAVFLLKVAVIWNTGYLNVDAGQVQHLVERIIDLITRASAGEKHLTRHISRGLGKMLERFKAWNRSAANTSPDSTNMTNPIMDSGAESSTSFTPSNMLISDMVGAYGFNLDEHFLDPYMPNYGFYAT
ncbi:hypothetical protein H105_01050 [Trichophyton soudanense CBS 452.61]|uniref:Zn(2)-C6 fungal-type domain-containing protein n=1 Tax=Trichophyton soudanense CBS 452.61 TaxID=1215331 RepID=A0A022Y4B5_TRISD|nr:hypothetical protein H105_01050 [Trichophyton soudanense CBS 452.61]EZG10355.1 hypothetical protein H106_00847 [Trichophyton rubrum CBS 735.88]